MSPTVEEPELSQTEQELHDKFAPAADSETTQQKEIPVTDEEKETQTSEDEEEVKPIEPWEVTEEAAPDASFEAGSGGTTHDFGEEEDEDEDDD